MINEWKEILVDCMDQHLAKIIISGPRKKDSVRKIEIRPVLLKEQLVFQASAYTEKQVQHYNLTEEEVYEKVAGWMEGFRQLEVLHAKKQVQVLVSKKGKRTVRQLKSGCPVPAAPLEHNRRKKYILDPDIPVPFLHDLGVQTKEGKIVHSRYDKFRQMNRFLEFIEDIVPELPKDRESVIIDFGCGKSYLTFAMYYYLHELKHYDVRIIGLDLKADVIAHCQQLAEDYGYEKLTFLTGDIADYDGVDHVDMVVTLHACDTAAGVEIWADQRADVCAADRCHPGKSVGGGWISGAGSGVYRYGTYTEKYSASCSEIRQTETGGGTDKDDGGTACFPNTGSTDERRKGCSRCVEEYRKF